MPPPAAAQSTEVVMRVIPEAEEFCAWGLPEGRALELRLDGTPVNEVATGQECVSLNPDGEQPIAPAVGRVVSLWDGTTMVDDLVIADIGVGWADPDTDSAWGWIAPYGTATIRFDDWGGQSSEEISVVDTDGDGRWTAEALAVDLRDADSQVVAEFFDGDGDLTETVKPVQDPWLRLFVDDDALWVMWMPGRSDVELAVDGAFLASGTTDDQGSFGFTPDVTGGFDFRVGQVLTVTSGSIVQTLEVVELTAAVDAPGDDISGTAPPLSQVHLFAWGDPDPWPEELVATADADGLWSIDTMAAIGYDLKPWDGGDLWVADGDGDWVERSFPTPVTNIGLTFDQDTYGSGGWSELHGSVLPPNTPVVPEGFDPSVVCAPTDDEGNFWCEVWPRPDVGETVTVTVGDVVRQLTIRELALDLPTEGGSPSGITEPDTEIGVTLNWDGQTTAWVTSDATGAWTSPTHTLSMGDEVEALIEEPDGDAQSIVRVVPNPRITVEPQVQSVQADDFPPPPGSTGDEPYPATLSVVSPGGATCTLDMEMRNGSGRIEMWSLADPRCAIHPGDTVEVTSEGLTKSVVVEPLEITSVDTVANSIGGVAAPWVGEGDPPVVELSFESWESGWGGSGFAEVHEDGSWRLPDLYSWDSEPWTLSLDDWIQAWVNDEDGDRTLSLFVRPGLSVNPDLDHVWGWGWPDGATIEMNGETWNVPTLCYANMAYWYTFLEPQQGPFEMAPCDGPATGYPSVFLDVGELGIDILPGDVVTMSDASSTSLTATVATIEVHQVDITTSTITGSSDVPVWMNLFTGLAMGFDGPQFGEDWVIDLTTHPYYPGMTSEDRGSFRGSQAGERGETIVRWFATPPAYTFEGFTAPVDMRVENVAKAGQTIPLKFRLTSGGRPIMDLTSVTLLVKGRACDLGASADQIETYTSGSSGLQNLGDGYYQYNWKTPKGYAKSCRELTVDLGTYGTFPATPVTFRFTR